MLYSESFWNCTHFYEIADPRKRRIRFLTESKIRSLLRIPSCMNRCFSCCFPFLTLLQTLFLRNGVITASSPRMASQQSFYGKEQAFERAVFPECLQGVLRTGRSEAAACRLERGDAHLVETDEHDEREGGNLLDAAESLIQPLFHFALTG